MAVIAKFRCNSVTEDGQVYMSAVYDSNPESENGRFFQATPFGELRMGTVNEAALAQFEEGKEYFLTFTKAENDK